MIEKEFLSKFVYLTEAQQELVRLFMNAAKEGWTARLIITGPVGTGKTRLATALQVMIPNLLVFDQEGNQQSAYRKAMQSNRPAVIVTSDWRWAKRQKLLVLSMGPVDRRFLQVAGIEEMVRPGVMTETWRRVVAEAGVGDAVKGDAVNGDGIAQD